MKYRVSKSSVPFPIEKGTGFYIDLESLNMFTGFFYNEEVDGNKYVGNLHDMLQDAGMDFSREDLLLIVEIFVIGTLDDDYFEGLNTLTTGGLFELALYLKLKST